MRTIGAVAFGLYGCVAYLARQGEPDLGSGCAGHQLIALLDDRDLTAQAAWLAEHAENGLPTRAELETWLAAATDPGDAVRLAFHGDFRVTDAQFEEIVLARHRPTPAHVSRFARHRLAHRPDTRLGDEPTPYTNRVFAVVDRGAQPGSSARTTRQ